MTRINSLSLKSFFRTPLREISQNKVSTVGVYWLACEIFLIAMQLFGLAPSTCAYSQVSTSFDLQDIDVPKGEIHRGGPPKDGIPALVNPRFMKASEARYLRPDDRVVGITIGGESRAYPLAILNYHEIVNDSLGETRFAVTYCPLCDSAAIFNRSTPGGVIEFGVSGLLYNSNVLMFDRGGKTESLWSQMKGQGISGPGIKQSLERLPLELSSWKEWTQRYPETLVMSTDTGHRRNYQSNPYEGYFKGQALMFPAKPVSKRLPAKSRVLGIWTSKSYRAYPESSFTRDHTKITDQLDGLNITIEFNPDTHSLRVVAADEGIQWMYSLWFAWYAFHPETTVYDPTKAGR